MQNKATMRLLVRGASGDVVESALKNWRSSVSVRSWHEEDVESTVIKLIPNNMHIITGRMFCANINYRISRMPGHSWLSLFELGSARFDSQGRRSKDGYEGLRCESRIGRQAWPNVMIEVGYSDSLHQLRTDVQWWLESSGNLTKLAILVLVNDNPNNFHVEMWMLGSNPGRITRRSRATVPVCTSLIDIDATGAVTPPNATLTIPYDALFDTPNANGTDIILTANDLSKLASIIFVQAT